MTMSHERVAWIAKARAPEICCFNFCFSEANKEGTYDTPESFIAIHRQPNFSISFLKRQSGALPSNKELRVRRYVSPDG
jgi:hypothetical protein